MVKRPSPTDKDFTHGQKELVAKCTGTADVTIDFVRRALGADNKLLKSERLFNTLPFNFVHSIFGAIIETTDFGAGLLDEDQKNHRNLKAAPARKEYLDKLVELTWMSMELGKVNQMKAKSYQPQLYQVKDIDTSELFVKMLTKKEQIEVRRLIQYFAVAAISVPSSRAAQCAEAVRKGNAGGGTADGEGAPGSPEGADVDDNASVHSHGSHGSSVSAATTASGHLHGAYAGDEEPRSLEEAVDATLAVMGTILGASHKLLKYRRLLERSPVTYIHDLIMAVRSATGFADGLFVDMPHLDTKNGVKNAKSDNDADRFDDRKVFCTRIILCVANFHGQPIDFVDHHSIMYGHDEIDVNRLLVAVGRAGRSAKPAERPRGSQRGCGENAIAGKYDPPMGQASSASGTQGTGFSSSGGLSAVGLMMAKKLAASTKHSIHDSAPEGASFGVDFSVTVKDHDVASFDEAAQKKFIDAAVKAMGITWRRAKRSSSIASLRERRGETASRPRR